ncbi:hypothetical protein EZH22_17710 [Xanthobacter dioxanivorans]|uniref:Uncharacterized protein n=1 Tax=Xanthobacter dioxanivorans TaxID=2528964 RepID=A0A974PJY1_9HYPH|nr:hypothetical protein [Xanthobacter dioxanivorans]QRG04963.1 hypothetical protein EZH22_17710 [Xanthobacter dioxanivorans]
MTSLATLTAALLHVRAYLAREARDEDIRNEAAWEAGSAREEHAAAEALNRLDEALRQLKPDASLPTTEEESAYAAHRQFMAA